MDWFPRILGQSRFTSRFRSLCNIRYPSSHFKQCKSKRGSVAPGTRFMCRLSLFRLRYLVQRFGVGERHQVCVCERRSSNFEIDIYVYPLTASLVIFFPRCIIYQLFYAHSSILGQLAIAVLPWCTSYLCKFTVNLHTSLRVKYKV